MPNTISKRHSRKLPSAAAKVGQRKPNFKSAQLEEKWEEKVRELLAYKKIYGHCIVPTAYSENRALSIWMKKQRSERKRMSEGRRARLDAIDFVWGTTSRSWDEMFLKLQGFIDKFGHCNVSPKSKAHLGLASWVRALRLRRDTVSPDRIKVLDSIGFDWAHAETHWDEMYKLLILYKEKNGHCDVSLADTEDKSLRAWVSTQRARRARLSTRRYDQLKELGFNWSFTADG